VEPQNEHHALPGPSLWPVGLAVGIATLLVGLILSWVVAAVGAALAVKYGDGQPPGPEARAAIGAQARKLADNDVIQLAGVKMGFFES
jgi:hypothetical protein